MRATTTERHSMISLQRCFGTAVRASPLVTLEKFEPLRIGERTGGSDFARPSPPRVRQPDLWILQPVSLEACIDLLFVALFVRSISGQPRNRIVRPPAPHRLPRMLEMA